MTRVLVIALDAMGGAWFDHHLRFGRWPNLQSFAEAHHRLDVASMGASLHGAIWPSFASGQDPAHHGRYFWLQWLPGEMKMVRSDHTAFDYAPFWAGLAPTKRVTVVDVPYVPAVEAAGFRTLAGWGVHDEVTPASVPPEFGRDVRRRFGRHPLEVDTVEPVTPRQKLRMTRDLRRGVHVRARLVEDLAARRDWDLLVVNFGETHKAGHYLAVDEVLSPRLTSDEAYREIVRPLDSLLPRIVQAAGDDCHVLVCAMHGTKPQADYAPLAGQVVDLLVGRDPGADRERRDVLRRVRDLLPSSLHQTVWRRLPASVRAKREGARILAGSYRPGDPMFTLPADTWAAVRLNISGRERDGSLSAVEGAAWLDRLEQSLPEFTVEGGQPAFAGLWRRTRELSGPREDLLPDAYLMSNPGVLRAPSLHRADGLVLRTQTHEARNGVHTGDGFCLWRPVGGAAPAHRDVSIFDFAPSIAALLEAGLGSELPGRSFVAMP